MDKIYDNKTQYYNYAYVFSPTPEKINFCRYLKDKYSWENFRYDDKKWLSKTGEPLAEIKRRFPETVIEGMASIEVNIYLQEELEKIKRFEEKKEYSIKVEGLNANLYQYQQNTVGFLRDNGYKGLVCLDPGCGKTICSIACGILSKSKMLIICPSTVKDQWCDEIKKFSNLRPFVFRSEEDYSDYSFDDYDAFIINYDILDRLVVSRKNARGKKKPIKTTELFEKIRVNMLVADEVTMIKESSSYRSLQTVFLSRRFDKILLLTGTPIINSPKDLFVPLNIIDYNRFENFISFAFRYCAPIKQKWGWDFSGSSNMDELREIIRPYYIRYRKREVLTDLPPTIFIDIPLDIKNEYKKDYNFALDNLKEYLKKIKKKTEKESEKSLKAEKLVLLNELRMITSESKSDDAVIYIKNILESGEKIIVFSNFHSPLEKLYNVFKDISVMVTGDTKEKDRNEFKKTFQNDDSCRIFFAGTKSCGLGLTLNRAENVLFIDQPWTEADYEQAYGRSERIGNKAKQITIRTMYIKNSIDQKISDIINRKKGISNFLFDDISRTSIVGELLTEIEKE